MGAAALFSAAEVKLRRQIGQPTSPRRLQRKVSTLSIRLDASPATVGASSEPSTTAEVASTGVVVLRHSYEQQHTLSWRSAIRQGGATLEPGSCNLYSFPVYMPSGGSGMAAGSGEGGGGGGSAHAAAAGVVLRGAQLDLLSRVIILAAAAEPTAQGAKEEEEEEREGSGGGGGGEGGGCGGGEGGGGGGGEGVLCSMTDCTGARVFHALVIANTSASIALALAIFHQRPARLPTPHSDGPFKGEHAMHILAVNRRERELCTLIRLARDRLDADGFRCLLREQCVGPFFDHPPMAFYGGTLMGYLAAFGLKASIGLLLAAAAEVTAERITKGGDPTEEVEEEESEGSFTNRSRRMIDAHARLRLLDDPRYACVRTGFLPLHAAVANGRAEAFDFLIGKSVELDGESERALYRHHRHHSPSHAPSSSTSASSSIASTARSDGAHAPSSRSKQDVDVMAESRAGDGGSRAPRPRKRFVTLRADVAATYLMRTAVTIDHTLSGLTPLQLAARLGDHSMCAHILRARLIFNWRWGPLASYRMELSEIDSAGQAGNDIMEVVASLEASERTRELLLDTFMQGFLHELFLQKWSRFAGGESAAPPRTRPNLSQVSLDVRTISPPVCCHVFTPPFPSPPHPKSISSLL